MTSYRPILQSISETLKRPRYALLMFVSGLSFWILNLYIPNKQSIQLFLSLDTLTFFKRWKIVTGIIMNYLFNLGAVNAGQNLIVSILFGLNLTLAVYLLIQRKALMRDASSVTSGILGSASALLGIGCSACGSILLTTSFSVFGGVGLVGLLPFKGKEFFYLSFILLMLSIYLLAKKMTEPLVCKTIKT